MRSIQDKRGANLEKAIMSGTVILSAYIMKMGIDAAYEKITGDKPPHNPAQKGISWQRALIWSAATGVLLGVAKAALRPKIDRGVQRLLSD